VTLSQEPYNNLRQGKILFMFKRSFFTSGNVIYLVAAFTIFIYLMFSIGSRTIQLYGSKAEADGLKEEIAALEQENKHLLKNKELVTSDAYIEKMAREELGMSRPGEQPVIILSDADKSSEAENAATTAKDPRPYWRQWWDMFFGN